MTSIRPSEARRLRPPVKWALAITSAATLAALIWPAPAVVGVNDERPAHRGPADEARRAQPVALVVDGSAQARARSGPAAAASAADFDPFVGLSLAPVAVPPPAPSSQVVAPPPPPPPPPPNDYRFVGRMTGPDGAQQILLGHGDAIIAISKGMTLDNGYRVESISSDAVVLAFARPDGAVTVSLPIPPDALPQ